MTRLPLFIGLLVVSACASTSQSESPDGERIAEQLASMDAALDLTDDQTVRIRSILEAQAADRPARPPRGAQGTGGRPGGDRGAGRQAQQAETDRQIEAVLRPEQISAYRTWRSSQPTRQGPPPRDR